MSTLTDADIVEIRDDLLPSQGEFFDCIAFARAVLASDAATTPRAWRDALAERRRQVEVEGWTPEHDDEHDRGELAQAAACYASNAVWRITQRPTPWTPPPWPWEAASWKPRPDPRRSLIKAAALIIAEIERLDRASVRGAD